MEFIFSRFQAYKLQPLTLIRNFKTREIPKKRFSGEFLSTEASAYSLFLFFLIWRNLVLPMWTGNDTCSQCMECRYCLMCQTNSFHNRPSVLFLFSYALFSFDYVLFIRMCTLFICSWALLIRLWTFFHFIMWCRIYVSSIHMMFK